MNLKVITNKELHEKLKMFCAQENKLNQDILAHLVEVDRRKLFLEMAYPSLFEYLTTGIGFSAASAQRRIDAARLMRQIPEVAEQLNSGAVSMVQLGKIQAAGRLLKKRGSIVTVENKKTLLNAIQNKSVRETELIIAQTFDLPVVTLEKSVLQKDESVRMEITFTKEEMEKIKSAKALLSHSLGDGNLKDLFLYLADKVILQKTKVTAQKAESRDQDFNEADRRLRASKPNKLASVRKSVVTKRVPALVGKNLDPNSKDSVTSNVSGFKETDFRIGGNSTAIAKTSFVPVNLKKFIFQRDKCCQYREPHSGRKCGSHYFLEVDHIQPKWSGGSDRVENLRLLCGSHNKYRYQIGR